MLSEELESVFDRERGQMRRVSGRVPGELGKK